MENLQPGIQQWRNYNLGNSSGEPTTWNLAEKEDRMNKMHRKKADLIHMLEIAEKCRQDILAIECNNRSQTWVYFFRLLWPMADVALG